MSKAENDYVRIDHEYDPDRCGAVVAGTRQCHYKRLPPSLYCPAHGGKAQQSLEKKARLANYNLKQYSQRVGEFANNPEIKSLREEVALMRLSLETIVNQCDSDNKLLSYTDKIVHMAEKIGVLIERCQKIEERNSDLLDRKVVMVIADEMISVIKLYITDPDLLIEAGGKIADTIAAIGSVQTMVRHDSGE